MFVCVDDGVDIGFVLIMYIYCECFFGNWIVVWGCVYCDVDVFDCFLINICSWFNGNDVGVRVDYEGGIGI